jgi:type I restriction enzyme S subunit
LHVQKIIADLNVGSTNQLELPRAAVAELFIPLPPLPEQRRIAARIDELFADIAKGEAALERARRGLDTWRRALLQAAVTGELTRDWREANCPIENGTDLLVRIGLRADGSGGQRRSRRTERPSRLEAPPFDPPIGWAWAAMAEVVSGMDYGTSQKCGSEPVGVPVLRMGNIQQGEIDPQRLKYAAADKVGGFLLREGDLLFNRTNSAELVGKTAIYRGRPAPCSFASYLVRLRVAGCDAEFVNSWLNSAYSKSWVVANKSQQVGQANLSAGKLRAMPIPIPPLAEQREITRRLRDQFEAADNETRSAIQGSADSAALRQSVLKAAFEGRLALQDPTDEPASVLLARLRERAGGVSTGGHRGRRGGRAPQPSLPAFTAAASQGQVPPR